MESFSLAKPEDGSELIDITMEAFNEPFSTVKFVFENRIDFDHCYVCKVGGKIVSLVHVFPMDIKLNNKIFKSSYIYGACTLPKYQGKGYMTRLLNFLEKDLKEKNRDFVFLVPETKSLVPFYEKSGYKNFFKTKMVEFTNIEFKNLCKKTIKKEIRDLITSNDDNKEQKSDVMSKKDKMKMILNIETAMKEAAKNLDFEKAMELRDILFELKSE